MKRCHCPSIAQLPLATGSRILRSTQPFSILYSTTGEPSLRLMRSRVKPILTVKPLFQDIADLFSLSLDCFRPIRRDQDPPGCPTTPYSGRRKSWTTFAGATEKFVRERTPDSGVVCWTASTPEIPRARGRIATVRCSTKCGPPSVTSCRLTINRNGARRRTSGHAGAGVTARLRLRGMVGS